LSENPSGSRDAEPGQGGAPVPGPLTALLYGFIHLIGIILVFGLGASLVESTSALLLNQGVAALVAPLLALYLALARWAPTEPTAAAVGLVAIPGGRWRGAAVIFFAVILGVSLAPLAAELTARVIQWWPMPPIDPEALEKLEHEHMSLGVGVVLVLCLVVLAPLAEEALYRGFLSRRVHARGDARPGGLRAALVVATIFSLVQLNPRACPGGFVLGLALVLAARAGGSTWVAVAMRVAFQATPIALALLLDTQLPAYSGIGDEDLFLYPTLTACGAGIAALAAFALWRMRVRPQT